MKSSVSHYVELHFYTQYPLQTYPSDQNHELVKTKITYYIKKKSLLITTYIQLSSYNTLLLLIALVETSAV